jgi:LysM repeat protein
MSRSIAARNWLLALLALALAGCGGPERPPTAAPPPLVLDPAPPEAVVDIAPEPEPALRERWRSPFAVSSSGSTAAREPRAIVVVGADPALAAGMPEQPDAAPESLAPPSAEDGGEEERPPAEPVSNGAAPERSAQPPETVASPPQPSRPAAHVVQRGDTWLGIAGRYRVSPSALAEANPGVDPERIRIDQTLRLPGSPSSAPRVTHRVGPGDTLWGIARRYDVSLEQLRELNGLRDDRVRPGQLLEIPAGEGRS